MGYMALSYLNKNYDTSMICVRIHILMKLVESLSADIPKI